MIFQIFKDDPVNGLRLFAFIVLRGLSPHKFTPMPGVHKDWLSVKNKEYYEANKVKRAEYDKIYYENNRQTILDRKKVYYQGNKEIISINNIEYRRTNKNKVCKWNRTYYLKKMKAKEESDK